ncbi:flagellar filament capping protein FliD [Chitinimonas sp. BJYL2]|uniref:flagellar filament capping protein FliD n=1 Tax=Chitinimonas sp. BJYL2 TaxID=2976696 RepID=UPI0022B583A0|nr:flagellar filament capping protein FliD [Chitinimonas sp. BJYL2]
MAITSTGLGSGLDIEGLLSKLISAERDPVANKIKAQGTTITNKVSALGSISGALSAFQSATRTLESSSQYIKPAASSSDASSITANASSAALLGSHTLSVSQLAQNQRLKTGVFSSADAVIGTGKLIIDFGKITKLDGSTATPDSNGYYDETDIKFTTNSSKDSLSITIDSQHNTLTGIRDAINATGAPITASVVNDGGGFRLVLSSTDTGVSNSLRITVSDDSGGSTDLTGLSQLAYDVTRPKATNALPPYGQNLSEVQSAKNATFTVDGIGVSSESNNASSVISGVTFNLLKTTTSPVTISVARDASTASKGLDSFVKAYNELRKVIKDTTYYDASTRSAGPLQGETVIRTIEAQLRNLINGTTASGTFKRLSDVGISFDKAGTMLYDSTKFSAAIGKDAASVAALFGSYGVASDSQVSYFSTATGTKAGNYAINITQMATQGQLIAGAAAASPTNIDLTSTTNTLSVTVNGVTSGTVTLNAANYATAGELALELQSKINGDSILKASGVGVTVAFDSGTGTFSLTSNRYGSSSTIALNSISSDLTTALGLSTSDPATTGLNIAGSIGNSTATGDGQFLTGAGDAAGLKIQVTGGSAGNRGTLSFSRGFAVQINDAISSMQTTNGALSSRQNALNRTLEDLTKQLDKLSTRMTDLEKRYRAQFTALDVTISSLRNTSNYLSQQLANLPSTSSR